MSSQTASSTAPRNRLRAWPSFLDGATDGAVVAFAIWTLAYEVALAGQLDLRRAGWPLLVVTAVVVVAMGVRESSRSTTSGPRGVENTASAAAPSTASGAGRRLRIAVAVGTVALAAAVIARDSVGVLPAVVLAIVLVLAVTRPAIRHREAPVDREAEPPVRQLEHAAALLASLGTGVVALFLLKPDADDAFYVNRAAWVAQHGVPTLRDTMFGPETYAQSFGGGLPTPSVEAVQGVIAHLLGLEAATTAYLVWAPALAVVFGWATWRLVRAWAPRRRALVLGVALVFVLASAASIIGSYSVGRMWQGKVTAYAVLLPIVWTHFTSLAVAARRRGRDRQLVLLACGVAFVGLTTSSALLAPVVAGGGLLAALALRSRPLALGALAFVAGPVVNGAVQVLGSSGIGSQTEDLYTSTEVFTIAFGSGTALAVLGLVATALGPGIARRPAGVVAGAAGAVALLALLPGMLALADAVTGAGPVVWRLAIVAPTGVLVGLLAALPLGSSADAPEQSPRRARQAVVAVVAAAAVAVPLIGGRWLWSDQAGAELTSTPTWKVDQNALADVRAARRLQVAPGRWLLPPVQMEVLAISTAGPHAVVPRAFYLPWLESTDRVRSDRQLLLRLVTRSSTGGQGAEGVRAALDRLDVSLACVPGDQSKARRILSEAVGARLRPVGTMACHVAPEPAG